MLSQETSTFPKTISLSIASTSSNSPAGLPSLLAFSRKDCRAFPDEFRIFLRGALFSDSALFWLVPVDFLPLGAVVFVKEVVKGGRGAEGDRSFPTSGTLCGN